MLRQHQPIPLLANKERQRFCSKVDRASPHDCWPWIGSLYRTGYGNVRIRGKTYRSHRVAWAIAKGVIPAGLCVLHKCDNRACCNPEHLFLGSLKDNITDMYRKGRARPPTGKAHGSRTHPERLARGNRHGTHTKPESIPRGIKRPGAKLTEYEVKQIRRLYAAGDISHSHLAAQYGVCQQPIWCILVRRHWKHVG